MNVSAKIGAVQFDGDTVRVAVVKTGGKRPKVLEYQTVRANVGDAAGRHDALVNAAREIVSALSTRPTMFVLCVSSAASISRSLTIPFRGRRRVAEAVPFDLEPHLAFPIEEVLVDYLPVREVSGQTQVLAVGVRRDAVEEQLDILEEAGVAVESVGLDALGLTALWHAQAPSGSGARAVIHIQPGGTMLAGLVDRRLAYLRNLDLSTEQLASDPGNAARTIKNALRAFETAENNSESLASISFTGLSLRVELQETLREVLESPLSFDDLGTAVAGARVIDGSQTEWMAPTGVAFAAGGSNFSLDFIDAVRGTDSRRGMLARHLRTTAGLAVTVLGLFFAYGYVDYRKNQDDIEQLGNQIWEEFVLTFPESPRAAERPAGDIGGFRTFELMQEESEREAELSQAISVDRLTKPTLLEILGELSERMPEDAVTVTDLRITFLKKLEIEVRGTVKDSRRFPSVLENLRQSGVFDVDPNRLSRSSSGGDETFVIFATR